MGFILLLFSVTVKAFNFSLFTILLNMNTNSPSQRSFLDIRWLKDEYIMIHYLWNWTTQIYIKKVEAEK